MATCVPDKIISFLSQRQISVASIQRSVVWNPKKIKDIYNNLIISPIFFGNIYSKEIVDDYDAPVQLIYDGLQRTSTLLLFWKVIFEDTNDIFCERYQPAKLVFSNKELQLDWDDIKLNTFKRKSLLHKNYITIKNAFNEASKEIQDLIKRNFKNSTWYSLNIPDGVDPNEFYITINSKGTLMSFVDVIRGFYPENGYQTYNYIMQDFKELERKIFLKDIAYLENSGLITDPLEIFGSDNKRPNIENLKKYKDAYIKMLKICKNLVGRFLPVSAKAYFIKLELSSLPDAEKKQKKELMHDFLNIVQYLPNGGLANQKFYSVFHKLTINSSIDELKTCFKNFLKVMENVMHCDAFQYLENALKNQKYIKNNSKNNLSIINLLIMLDNILFANNYTRDNVEWTIEHVKAQSSKEVWVNNFGNLVLLNKPNNSRIGGDVKKQKGIDEKIYTNSGCRLTESSFFRLKKEDFSEKAVNELSEEYAKTIIQYLKQMVNWED